MIVLADGGEVFQLRYVRGATCIPRVVSTRQIDSTLKFCARMSSMNWTMPPSTCGAGRCPRGGEGRVPSRRKSIPTSEFR